jgi:ferredoxin
VTDEQIGRKVRVVIDPATCQGHANCFAVAPGVFDVDADGRGLVAAELFPAEAEPAARMAAHRCPEEAISIQLVRSDGGEAA